MPYDDGQVAVALRPPLDGGVWAWNSYVLCRVGDREILAFAELCDGDIAWLHGLDEERTAFLEAKRGKTSTYTRTKPRRLRDGGQRSF